MAKVYDALRRAEEERRKLSDSAAQPVARLEWEPEVAPETAAKAPKPPRESLLRRGPWSAPPVCCPIGHRRFHHGSN